MYSYLLLIIWFILWPEVESTSDIPFLIQANFITISTAILLSTVPKTFGEFGLARSAAGKTKPRLSIRRQRKSVCQIFLEY
jgi:hypothetical protein